MLTLLIGVIRKYVSQLLDFNFNFNLFINRCPQQLFEYLFNATMFFFFAFFFLVSLFISFV